MPAGSLPSPAKSETAAMILRAIFDAVMGFAFRVATRGGAYPQTISTQNDVAQNAFRRCITPRGTVMLHHDRRGQRAVLPMGGLTNAFEGKSFPQSLGRHCRPVLPIRRRNRSAGSRRTAEIQI